MSLSSLFLLANICYKRKFANGGRFYLHKEAQSAQNAQTEVKSQKYLKDSICTKVILFAQIRFFLHKGDEI